MDKKTYYWLCSYPLDKGSIVLPGNWGRMVGMYNQNFGNPLVKLREEIFENIRKLNYIEKPSRLSCLYLCQSLVDIKKFKQETNRSLDLIYQVYILDPNKKIFITSWKLADLGERNTATYFQKKAEEYWNYSGNNDLEVLTESKIVILNQLE